MLKSVFLTADASKVANSSQVHLKITFAYVRLTIKISKATVVDDFSRGELQSYTQHAKPKITNNSMNKLWDCFKVQVRAYKYLEVK